MHELVLVFSDFYVSQQTSDRELPAGVTLPGLQHLTRFGTRSKLASGWRPWLSRWLTGAEGGAPATVAAASTVENATNRRSGATPTAATQTAAARTGAAQTTAGPTAAARTAAAPTAAPTTATAIARSALEHPVTGARHHVAWMATPMHLIAGMTSVHVDRRSILRLDASDQATLAEDFQRIFHDSGFHLQPLEAGDFLMLGPEMPQAATQEPARSLGGSMAQHADASVVLRRLGAEIEMWLHDHPINDTRRKRGALPVTSLWLWGAGSPLACSDGPPPPAPAGGDVGAMGGGTSGGTGAEQVLAPDGRTVLRDLRAAPAGGDVVTARATASDSPANASDAREAVDGVLAFGRDSYVQGLWAIRGAKVSPLPQQLVDVFGYPHAQRAVLVIEIGVMLQSNPKWTFFEAVADIDRRFVAPAVEALNRGRYSRLVVLANDYELTLRANNRLKFWRRTPPGLSGLQ